MSEQVIRTSVCLLKKKFWPHEVWNPKMHVIQALKLTIGVLNFDGCIDVLWSSLHQQPPQA